MLKAFVIFLSVIACSGTGLYQSYRLKSRLKSLCSLKTALSMLETHIRFSGTDMERAMREIDKQTDTGGIFLSAAEGIKSRGAEKAWRIAIKNAPYELNLSDADKNTLSLLSTKLGMTDEAEQIKNIQYVSSLLDINIKSARYNSEKYCRLYSGGGFMAGIFIGLLLI